MNFPITIIRISVSVSIWKNKRGHCKSIHPACTWSSIRTTKIHLNNITHTHKYRTRESIYLSDHLTDHLDIDIDIIIVVYRHRYTRRYRVAYCPSTPIIRHRLTARVHQSARKVPELRIVHFPRDRDEK